eukprot:2506446-Prymnesium_polylepis.1
MRHRSSGARGEALAACMSRRAASRIFLLPGLSIYWPRLPPSAFVRIADGAAPCAMALPRSFQGVCPLSARCAFGSCTTALLNLRCSPRLDGCADEWFLLGSPTFWDACLCVSTTNVLHPRDWWALALDLSAGPVPDCPRCAHQRKTCGPGARPARRPLVDVSCCGLSTRLLVCLSRSFV